MRVDGRVLPLEPAAGARSLPSSTTSTSSSRASRPARPGAARRARRRRASARRPGSSWRSPAARSTCSASGSSAAPCGLGYEVLDPRLFSFNSRQGACPACQDSASRPSSTPSSWSPIRRGRSATARSPRSRELGLEGEERKLLRAVKAAGIAVDRPFKRLTARQRRLVLEGRRQEDRGRPGRCCAPRGFYEESEESGAGGEAHGGGRHASLRHRATLRRVPRDAPRRARARVRVLGRTFPELASMTVDECAATDRGLASSRPARRPIVRGILGPRSRRASASSPPSASGISRSTAAPTRSPAARHSASGSPPSSARTCAAPATCSTSRPSGCTRATTRSCSSRCGRSSSVGNTVIVVEHDEATIAAADLVVDLGPGARSARRRALVAVGTPAEIAADPSSLTGRYLHAAARARSPGASDQRQACSRSTTPPPTI